jgi:hypothetical protein
MTVVSPAMLSTNIPFYPTAPTASQLANGRLTLGRAQHDRACRHDGQLNPCPCLRHLIGEAQNDHTDEVTQWANLQAK